MRENVIEWLNGQDWVSVSFAQGKYITKIRKLAESHPDEVKIIAENPDGSICAHVPLKYIKVSPPKKMSEEQIAAATERMKNMHKK